MNHTPIAYNALFAILATTFHGGPDGWETRQEPLPPQAQYPDAYLHISRAGWKDESLNGIHIEAYVMSNQLRSRAAVVALHCEGGWPTRFREMFVRVVTERARPTIEGWNREEEEEGGVRWKVQGPTGMSICEVRVPFGSSPRETVDRVEAQLRRLQTLARLIDEVIAYCERELELEASGAEAGAVVVTDEAACDKKVPLLISEKDVTRRDGRDGRPLWAVIDSYVVDISEFAEKHPGGLRKIMSANDAKAGWTGKAFGFSLSRGANAHFGKTGKTFRAGVAKFEKLGRTEIVDVDYSSVGTISIIGKLE